MYYVTTVVNNILNLVRFLTYPIYEYAGIHANFHHAESWRAGGVVVDYFSLRQSVRGSNPATGCICATGIPIHARSRRFSRGLLFPPAFNIDCFVVLFVFLLFVTHVMSPL